LFGVVPGVALPGVVSGVPGAVEFGVVLAGGVAVFGLAEPGVSFVVPGVVVVPPGVLGVTPGVAVPGAGVAVPGVGVALPGVPVELPGVPVPLCPVAVPCEFVPPVWPEEEPCAEGLPALFAPPA
jgi:hypothetical protein